MCKWPPEISQTNMIINITLTLDRFSRKRSTIFHRRAVAQLGLSKTHLDSKSQIVIHRQSFECHVLGSRPVERKKKKKHRMICNFINVNTSLLPGAYPQPTPAPSQEIATLPTPITREKKPTTATLSEVLN